MFADARVPVKPWPCFAGPAAGKNAGSMRPVWIVADPHGGAGGPADAALLELLDLARDRRADLFLLGDLFLGWIALERAFTPFQREVIERLRAHRRAALGVQLVVGNRDYLTPRLVGDVFDRVLEGEALIELGGSPVVVTHGDLLRSSDLAYRAWRGLTRSAPVSAVLGALPGSAAGALAARAERALRRTNLAYKTGDLPIPSLLELGRRAAARGARRALIGHFHHDRTLDVPGGAPVVIAPGWLDHQRILVLERGLGPPRSVSLAELGPGPFVR